jgi:hypothetical protein
MGADPQVINSGEGTALWWWSNAASSASIDNGLFLLILLGFIQLKLRLIQ